MPLVFPRILDSNMAIVIQDPSFPATVLELRFISISDLQRHSPHAASSYNEASQSTVITLLADESGSVLYRRRSARNERSSRLPNGLYGEAKTCQLLSVNHVPAVEH